ncbi:hypothetical protein PCE1_003675 [Barthelona sp. PCE]
MDLKILEGIERQITTQDEAKNVPLLERVLENYPQLYLFWIKLIQAKLMLKAPLKSVFNDVKRGKEVCGYIPYFWTSVIELFRTNTAITVEDQRRMFHDALEHAGAHFDAQQLWYRYLMFEEELGSPAFLTGKLPLLLKCAVNGISHTVKRFIMAIDGTSSDVVRSVLSELGDEDVAEEDLKISLKKKCLVLGREQLALVAKLSAFEVMSIDSFRPKEVTKSQLADWLRYLFFISQQSLNPDVHKSILTRAKHALFFTEEWWRFYIVMNGSTREIIEEFENLCQTTLRNQPWSMVVCFEAWERVDFERAFSCMVNAHTIHKDAVLYSCVSLLKRNDRLAELNRLMPTVETDTQAFVAATVLDYEDILESFPSPEIFEVVISRHIRTSNHQKVRDLLMWLSKTDLYGIKYQSVRSELCTRLRVLFNMYGFPTALHTMLMKVCFGLPIEEAEMVAVESDESDDEAMEIE